jgi:hypothetical protein
VVHVDRANRVIDEAAAQLDAELAPELDHLTQA